jgi:hypothetical protein
MAQTFVGCDRDQSFLMPPDIRDWLAEDHLAWFVLDAVAGMDLGEFYGAYRRDGVGRRPYDPAMMGGRPVVVFVFAGDSVGAGDRAGVPGGCCVSGDRDARAA